MTCGLVPVTGIWIYGTKYSKMDQVKIFKGSLSQIGLGPFLNTLSHMLVLLLIIVVQVRRWLILGVAFSGWKLSVFRVRIGEIRTRKTSNSDTFHAVIASEDVWSYNRKGTDQFDDKWSSESAA